MFIIPEYHNNKIFDNGDFNNLDNVNIVNSPSDDFNVSSEIHVQKFGINQIGHELDLSSLINLTKKFINNPIIGYLNINHLVGKMSDLRGICKKSLTDILCIDETKLDDSHPQSCSYFCETSGWLSKFFFYRK